jgi:hypothetical protein
MKTPRLGMTDLQVSRIAFGTWQLGGEWGTFDERDDPARVRARDRSLRHGAGLVSRRGIEADVAPYALEHDLGVLVLAGPSPESV